MIRMSSSYVRHPQLTDESASLDFSTLGHPFVGFHFKTLIHPIWNAVLDRQVNRASELGLVLSRSALTPKFSAFTIEGSQMFGYESGGLTCTTSSTSFTGVHQQIAVEYELQTYFEFPPHEEIASTLGVPNGLAVADLIGIFLQPESQRTRSNIHFTIGNAHVLMPDLTEVQMKAEILGAFPPIPDLLNQLYGIAIDRAAAPSNVCPDDPTCLVFSNDSRWDRGPGQGFKLANHYIELDILIVPITCR